MPGWLQPFTENSAEEPLASLSAGGHVRIEAESKVPPASQRSDAKPTSKHILFTYFLKQIPFVMCRKMTNTMRARSQERLEMRTDGVGHPNKMWRSCRSESQSFGQRQCTDVATSIRRGGARFLFVLDSKLPNEE